MTAFFTCRRKAVALIAAAAFFTAACGSTVQVSGGQLAQSEELGIEALDDATPSISTSTGTPASGGGATTSVGSQGAAGGASGPVDGAVTRPRTGSPGPTGAIPGRHRAVAAGTVKVGFLYLANAGTLVGSFGVQGYSQGDELGMFKALVADQNARGGVAGRKLEVVPRDLGGIDQASYQAACTYFTSDNPVFMVFSALAHIETLNACLAKAGVGYTSDALAPPDRLMRGLKSIYAPDDIAAERYAALLGRSLVDGGFFTPGAKAGIYRQDTPDYKRITHQILKPILAKAGVDVYEETFNAEDAAATISASAGVVFRMQSAGVTHVITYETPLYLMTAAESQRWYPYWSITSRTGPGMFMEGAAPREQLKRAMGPGWQPVSDIASSRLKGTMNSEEKRCLDTLGKAGHKYEGPPRFIGLMLCGELYHFVRVLATAKEFSTEGFRAAAESLTPYPSPLTFRLSFAGGRHDGAAAYRLIAWQNSCSCFGYVSALKPMPAS